MTSAALFKKKSNPRVNRRFLDPISRVWSLTTLDPRSEPSYTSSQVLQNALLVPLSDRLPPQPWRAIRAGLLQDLHEQSKLCVVQQSDPCTPWERACPVLQEASQEGSRSLPSVQLHHWLLADEARPGVIFLTKKESIFHCLTFQSVLLVFCWLVCLFGPARPLTPNRGEYLELHSFAGKFETPKCTLWVRLAGCAGRPACFGFSLLCCAIFLRKWDDLAGSLGWVVLVLLLTRLYFWKKWMLFARPKGSSLVDGFILLGFFSSAELRGALSGLFCFHLLLCSFCCLTRLLQKALSFCELRFAFFVPRIYFLLSLRAISEQIGESPVCDFR